MTSFINQDIYPVEFELHRKYASSELLLELIWTHTNIVAEIVQALLATAPASQLEIDKKTAIQAALLSDIGVYECAGYEWMPGQKPCQKPYIQHCLIGAWILNQEGFPPEVIQVAQTHTGVGILPEDVQKFALELPAADYTPKTPTQKIVSYASKFHSKSPKFKTTDEILVSLEKYGPDKKQIFQVWMEEFGVPNLDAILEKYANWHRTYNFKLDEVQQQSTSTAAPNLNSAGISK